MIMRCVVFELALRMVREEWKLAAIMAEFGAEVSDADASRQRGGHPVAASAGG